MRPICDQCFGPSTGPSCPAGAESKREIGGIGRLLDEAPEDLPCRNLELVTPEVIPADVHQPDEAALPAARNRKCASKISAVEALVVLLAGNLPPAFPSAGVSTSHDFR
jgi:hypothetical protein